MRFTSFALGAAALTTATPALADDWSLTCVFNGGIQTLIQYDAGWPRYSVAVTNGGKDLPPTKALPAGRISTPDGLLLFVNRQEEETNQRSIFIRLNSETMAATLEAGSGGFDYLAAKGTCRAL